MELEVAHFVDAGERDADGNYGYFYEGDNDIFSDGEEHVVLRTYVDDPNTASLVGMTSSQADASAVAHAAAMHMRSLGHTKILCLGESSSYEAWSPTS